MSEQKLENNVYFCKKCNRTHDKIYNGKESKIYEEHYKFRKEEELSQIAKDKNGKELELELPENVLILLKGLFQDVKELKQNQISNIEVEKPEISRKQQLRNEKIQAKIKNSLKSFMSFAGFVLYIWNPDTLSGKLKPLSHIGSIIRINKAESFFLGNPSLVIDGKPLFILVRGIPYSIEVILRDLREYMIERGFDEDDVNSKLPENNTFLTDKGYTSSDIDAKCNSLITARIFKLHRVSVQYIVLLLLLMLCTSLITFMITSTYYNAIITEMSVK